MKGFWFMDVLFFHDNGSTTHIRVIVKAKGPEKAHRKIVHAQSEWPDLEDVWEVMAGNIWGPWPTYKSANSANLTVPVAFIVRVKKSKRRN
jgi:hypothetical protein